MELVNADCLEYMKTLPEKSVDLFLCDLPYGVLTNNRVAKREGKLRDKDDPNSNIIVVNKPIEWDIPINLEEFWEQIKRLAKNDHTPILMFCSTKFGFELYNSNPNWFRYDLVWNKMRGVGFLSANKMPMRSHELIYVFSKKGANYYRKDLEGKAYFKKSKNYVCNQYGVQRVEGDNKGTRCILSVIDNYNTAGHKGGKHPTAKPVELYKFLIERYSKEGDTILDPTAGSFNSAVAAKELNRKYIGIELNKEYYEKAKQLLE